jgi:hypothetical protein
MTQAWRGGHGRDRQRSKTSEGGASLRFDLRGRVRHCGGHEQETLAADQRDERGEEYDGVVERDLERFQKWLASIPDRDYFKAPRGRRCMPGDTGGDGASRRSDLRVLEDNR